MVTRVISFVGKTLISLGLLVLAFVAFQLWGTNLEESQHQDELTTAFVEQLADEAPPASTEASTAPQKEDGKTLDDVIEALSTKERQKLTVPAAKVGDSVAVIEIPKIGVKKVVVEGTTTELLKKGPGHYVETPMPGNPGNAGIAGHRTTYGAPFNRINELSAGDVVNVYTKQGKFTYEVMPPPADAPGEVGPGWWIVDPDDVTVLAPTKDNRLTLTACHPEFSDRKRIIVAAQLSKTTPAAKAPAKKPEPAATGTDSSGSTVSKKATPTLTGWDTTKLDEALKWGAGAFLVWLVAFLIGLKLKRKRWISYLALSPVFFFFVWYGFTWLNRALPPI